MSNGTYAVIFFLGAFCIFFVLKWLIDKDIELKRREMYRYIEKQIKIYEACIDYMNRRI